MFKRLWQLLQPFHRTFGWFIILIVLYETLQIGESYLMSLVIRLFGRQVEIGIWLLLLAGLLIFDELFNRLDNAVDWHIIVKHEYPIFRDLKCRAVAKFLEMDMAWHQDKNSGALVGKVNRGVDKVSELLEGMSWEFVPTLIQAGLSLIPLLIFSPLAVPIVFLALVAFMWLTLKGNKKRRPYRKERHDLYEEEWHQSVELVQSVETAVMFSQKERLLKEHQNLHDQIVGLGSKEAEIGIYTYNRWRIRVLSIARRTILAIWIWQLAQGTLDIAGLIFVSVLSEKLFHSFWRFARLFNRATEASESIERLVNLMEERPEIADNGVKYQVSVPVGIEMKEVCFSYQKEYDQQQGTIHNLNLTIEPGQIIALVGPSGSGKTTIRKLITRLLEIQSGNILVGGIDLQGWSTSELQGLFSYVPQGDDVFIFSASMKDNIAYSKPEISFKKVVKAAKLAGIHDFVTSLPDGYNTKVGERGKKLSGGQKQRVALARAILADLPILFLDEATSSVDAITEREIQTKMGEILKGKTAIVVAHRLSTVWEIADRIIVLDEGRKIEEGTHSELMSFNGLYAKMVALQTNE